MILKKFIARNLSTYGSLRLRVIRCDFHTVYSSFENGWNLSAKIVLRIGRCKPPYTGNDTKSNWWESNDCSDIWNVKRNRKRMMWRFGHSHQFRTCLIISMDNTRTPPRAWSWSYPIQLIERSLTCNANTNRSCRQPLRPLWKGCSPAEEWALGARRRKPREWAIGPPLFGASTFGVFHINASWVWPIAGSPIWGKGTVAVPEYIIENSKSSCSYQIKSIDQHS